MTQTAEETVEDAPASPAIDALPRTHWLDRVVWVVSIAFIALSMLLVLSFGHGRDQSIYTLVARETLSGGMPYRDAFDFKPPGVFIVYMIARTFFGSAEWGIRVLEALSMAASAFFIVRLSERHFGSMRAGIIAAALASQVHAQMDFWHSGQPETFGGMMTLGAFVLATKALDAPAIKRAAPFAVGAGALLGMAGLMKPPLAGVGVIVAVAFLVHAWVGRKTKGLVNLGIARAAGIAIGGAIPFVLVLVWFSAKGALHDLHEVLFVFTPYYTKISWEGQSVLPMTYYGIVEWLTTYSSALLCGLVALLLFRPARSAWVPASIVLASIMMHIAGIVMQAKFFPYHWGATFPLTALLAGLGIDGAVQSAKRRGWGGIAFVVAFPLMAAFHCPVPSFGETFYYRTRERTKLALGITPASQRTIAKDGLASVADVNAAHNRAVSDWIVANTAPTDPIYVWGFECAIYDRSGRPASSRYIYNVPQRAPWSMKPMREALMADLAAKPPKVIVVSHGDYIPMVTGTNSDSAMDLYSFDALWDLLERDYHPEGTIGHFDVYLRREAEAADE